MKTFAFGGACFSLRIVHGDVVGILSGERTPAPFLSICVCACCSTVATSVT
jgi:hypothetical protein